ncbi:CrcB family protein [Nitrosarchaeum sp.]|uniref:fluoride efflux transporter FluC n=1 Tax=Nitrosarchaeum sp. TaxID=2026886 RepID=UPI00247B3867|nr:CrcB family protein [Nitrosarchaeum sp.]MCV0412586.1 CrcB family protein [Nitrosarchaeum sp.]
MKGLEFVFLAVGSVLGAFLRYKITESPLLFNTLPLNVLIVNVIGAFVLGMFIIISEQWNLDGRYSLLAAVGFCGSLTTMSSFALDSSNLFDNHHYGTLAINLVANVGLSIGALVGGRSLMSTIVNG